jgi:hypothetical protein
VKPTAGSIIGGGYLRPYVAERTTESNRKSSSPKMIQRVGDRDKESWSIRDIAFTIPANPMSDRIQLVIYAEEGCLV